MKNLTILVVDDEPVIRDIISEDLHADGYQVLTAESGRTALEICTKHKVDLILSDIRMPDGDGFFLAKEIRKLDPVFPPIVLLTAFADSTSGPSIPSGVKAIIPKPYDYDRFIRTIHELTES